MNKEKITLSMLKNGHSACQYARDFQTEMAKHGKEEGLKSKKNDRYDMAIIIKDVITQVMSGEADCEDITDMIESAASAYDETTKTAHEKAHKMYVQLSRYLNYEKREPHFGKRMPFENEYTYLEFKPDVYFLNGDRIELVIIKNGKPPAKNTLDPLPEYDEVKGTDINGDIVVKKPHEVTIKEYTKKMAVADLYYLLQYGKTLVPENESRIIQASMVYMGAPKEKADSPNLTFDPETQVLSVEITYSNNKSAKNLKDHFERDYEKLINECYEVGFDTCSDDDCKGCTRCALCEYKPMPEIYEKKEIKKRKKIVPSDAQAKVINATKGYFRVNAGAGAGKTECVSERFLNLVVNNGYNPAEILCITFTDAGAREMRERIAGKLMAEGILVSADDIPVMTFNTFAYRIVKQNYADVGFAKEPIVIDEVRQSRIITNMLEDVEISGLNYREFSMSSKYVVGALGCASKVFNIIKTEQINPDDPDAENVIREKARESGLYRFMTDQSISELLNLYVEYADQLKEDGLITFADQEPMALEIIRMHEGFLDEYGYKHIIVDEFQDSSNLQMELIRELIAAKPFESLMVVGDDSQSIYGFRGTTPENMINFAEKIEKPVTDLFLVDNYRSVPEVIELANMVNGLNEDKIEKDLIAFRGSDGTRPFIRGFYNTKDEYTWIAEEIKKKLKNGYEPEDIAFIAFTKNELVKMSQVLSEYGIPWVMMNPMNLMENSRVHAALSLCMAFYQPEATQLYFDYLVSKYDGELPDMDDLLYEIERMKQTFQNMENYTHAYQRARLHAYLNQIGGTDEVYQYFLGLLNQCEDLPTELAYASDFMLFGDKCAKKMEQSYKGVVLTTAHSSKGLEWKVVFNSISQYDSEKLHGSRSKKMKERVEEARRLLFVSITRARDELYLSGQYVAYGPKNNQTYNQFLRELYDLTGQTYNPIDPMDEVKKKERAERAKARRVELKKERELGSKDINDIWNHAKPCSKKAGGNKARSREMTADEKKQYNRMTAGSYQQTMFS